VKIYKQIKFYLLTFSFFYYFTIRFDLDFQVWVRDIDWHSYWYCMYVIMVAMAFEIVVSVAGILAVFYVRLS
jgi:hypothetical protein